ncbi:MAG: hypothetical protein MUO35_07200 [Anaerolineales bacterium]|nr:hypothetical protein [Anaerolineales bacterium]
MSAPEINAGPEATPQSDRPICTCLQDPLEALPPELRPKHDALSGLRETVCPACGLHYLTNRATEVCIRCEARHASAGAAAFGPGHSADG